MSSTKKLRPPKSRLTANVNSIKEEPVDAQPSGATQRTAGRRSSAARDGESGPSSQAAPATQQVGTQAGSRRKRRATTQAIPEGSEQPESSAQAEAAEAIALEVADDNGDEDILQRKKTDIANEAMVDGNQSAPISSREEAQLVRNVVRFMLFRQAQKPGVPVKREELAKLILGGYAGQRMTPRLTGYILRKADAKLVEAFGMEMAEITTRAQGRSQGDPGSKAFVLRSLLPARLRSLIDAGKTELSQAFAMVVLPLIALSGGRLAEDELATQLRKLGVAMHQEHPVLGKPADQIQELVNRRYLAKSRVDGPDGQQTAFAIGSVAMEEIGDERLKTYIDEMFLNLNRGQNNR